MISLKIPSNFQSRVYALTVSLSWIKKKQISKEYHLVFNRKTNHPSNFSFSAIVLTDKIKQHVLFLTSGNTDEYFYL